MGLVLLAASCTPAAWRNPPYDELFQRAPDPELHPLPSEYDASDWWQSFYHSSFSQFGSALSPGHHLQGALALASALDVNAFGKVPDSVWFENRVGRIEMTPPAVQVGPDELAGPGPGRLTILNAKSAGVTPGFVAIDSAGERWIIKLDPPAYPHMGSAAEVISTKLLHAAGYHVPENHVGYFRMEQLVLGPDATTYDRYHSKIPFTIKELNEIKALLNPDSDGRVRAVFSRFLPGRPVGPFVLQGRRLDDPNDRIPHDRRRSLRGLWVFYAWLNSTDAKVTNALDIFIEKDSKAKLGYLKHYLIDFGTSLGSAATGPKHMGAGYEHLVDWERIGGRMLTAGVTYPYWATLKRTPYREVGQFESIVFNPEDWRPIYPNAAFSAADAEDTFWAASILAHFTPGQIAAAVDAGQYRDPRASQWVFRVLLERREKLMRYAFQEVLALDNPETVGTSRLQLIDLEVRAGLRTSFGNRYQVKVLWDDADGDSHQIGVIHTKGPSIELSRFITWLEQQRREAFSASPFLTLEWSRAIVPPTVGASLTAEAPGKGAEYGGPKLWVQLRVLPGGSIVPIGLRRSVGK